MRVRGRDGARDHRPMQRRWCVAFASVMLVCSGCAPPAPAEAPAGTGSEPAAEGGAPGPDDLAATPTESGAGADSREPNPAAAPDSREPHPALEAGADDGLDADIAALSASTEVAGPSRSESTAPNAAASPTRTPKPETGPEAPGSPSPREIVYRVTPQGLVIEIDGIHLRPEAKAFKDKSGAYGIELVVKAESFDGRRYWVNEPEEGLLSIAGKVENKGGKRERFADQRVDRRSGSGEQLVMEGAPRRFKQRWPGRGQPKLWSGQTVTLEVGLWGVRAESERERPVRRLFEVKMVAGNKSPAVISPPTLDWGS
jgi:hypothetical protein